MSSVFSIPTTWFLFTLGMLPIPGKILAVRQMERREYSCCRANIYVTPFSGRRKCIAIEDAEIHDP